MKILAIAASNSLQSINKKLLTHVATLLAPLDVELIDINKYEVPIYGIDKEIEKGIPSEILELSQKIKNSDFLIISLAEHNGSYTAAFKNIFDWLSRVPDTKGFHNRKTLLLATSPGSRGASTVLEIARDRFPRNDASVIGALSVPSFNENFDLEKGIINPDIKQALNDLLHKIK